MSESGSDKTEAATETILPVAEILSSGEDPPMSEWSSLEVVLPEENKKRCLAAQGLYSPGSGELCAKYIAMSDSDVFRHVYYNYPAVLDPGIKEAILSHDKPVVYPDDGQELYKALCEEMNTCVVNLFYKNLCEEEINLSYYGVNPAGIRPMAMALRYNKFVKRLNLTDNFLKDDACYHLGQMLITNTTLKELNIAGCRIGASGMLRLGEGLPLNRSLTTLNLARNQIGEKGGEYFAKQIDQGATVLRVNLSYNKLGKDAAYALTEVLEIRNKMTHLDLSWNNFFHVPSAVKMLDQIANSEVLQELNLSWNALEGERVAGAIEGILLIPTLKILDLSNNRFQGPAIPLITSNLMKAKKLVTLDLSGNPLSTSDAYAVLQKMLRPRVKLENLLLEHICVSKEFPMLLERIRGMKSRKNFFIKYGKVLQNWTTTGPDPREMILKRAEYLCTRDKKRRADIALFFLQLNKECEKPIPVKDLTDKKDNDGVPLDDDLITELSYIFPGPKSAKTRSINLMTLCEYMMRLWPDRKLPPTPPPEPEPELPPPPPPKEKGKKGKGKK